MKNYLKTGIVLIGISLLLWNCKYDDELIIHENEVVTNSKYSVPEISNVKSNFEVFETQHKIFNKNIKSTASKQKGNDGIYIDWENSKKYKFKANENIDILYTPIIYDKKGHRMKSLLASVENEGLIESFIFTLVYDESSTKTIFSGLIYKHDIEGNFIKVYKYSNGKKISEGILKTNSNINKNTSNRLTQNDMNPCEFALTMDDLIWMAVVDWESGNSFDCITITGSAGSSNTDGTSWSDPDLNLSWGNTSIPYVGTSDTNIHVTNTTNTGTTIVPTSTAIIDENWYSEVTSAEALLAVKVIKSKLTLNAEQTTWVENSVNNNMSSWQLISLFSFLTTNNYSTDALNFAPLTINAYITSGSVDYVDRIIIDSSFENSKANCAYKLLKDNQQFNQILDSLLPKDSEYNIIFKIGDPPGNATGSTSPNTDPNKQDITVTIDEWHAQNNSIVSVALTILHEAVHARLIEKVKSLGGLANLNEFAYLDSEMEKLAAYYNKYGALNNPAHHEFIWDNYVDIIANGVESFHKLFPEDYISFHNNMIQYPSYYKNTFYELVVKGSLQETSYFKNLTEPEKIDIQALESVLKSSAKKITDTINCK
ncbi:MAG: hypothetical protein WAV86_03555 [Lutibacter sp.]